MNFCEAYFHKINNQCDIHKHDHIIFMSMETAKFDEHWILYLQRPLENIEIDRKRIEKSLNNIQSNLW